MFLQKEPFICKIYSTDASIFEVVPKAVFHPQSVEELKALLTLAKKEGLSLIARGAATGISGGCLGEGIVVDLSRHLTHIKTIDYEKEIAVVEPGVILDDLNRELGKRGYRIGPETSTSNRATIGGMAANDAAGGRSLKYGTMKDHVVSLKVLLASGEEIVVDREHVPFKEELFRLKNTYKEEIKKSFPKLPRRASGYNLEALIEEPFHPQKLLIGSEGTLGIFTEITLKIIKKEEDIVLVLFSFDDVIEAMEAVPKLLAYQPLAIEMIDDKILEMAKQSPTMKEKAKWLQKIPRVLFLCELEKEKAQRIQGGKLVNDKQEMQEVYDLRKAGLGLLLSKRTMSRSVAFIEDLSIPPVKLAPFFKTFLPYLKKLGKEAGIYGHVGSGCMHLRPYMDLSKPEEVQLMQQMMFDTLQMVQNEGGVLSGEHGDGLIRSWLNKKLFGETLYSAFVELKQIFDPDHLMNPGKITAKEEFPSHLRAKPLVEIPTYLNFEKEGGLSFAADMCNGNGLCRKKEGVMCPSFQATGDEYDSTRARANALREALSTKGAEEELKDILDLCLQCKGCKTECPSSVDMAKMKEEVLYRYYKTHKRPLRDYLFGNIGALFSKASRFSRLFNRLSGTFLAKQILSFLNISTDRTLPQLAAVPFSRWFKEHVQSVGKEVVLFIDTFSEYIEPHIAESAVKVLNALGYKVICPPYHCCGRTYLSKGLLEEANKKGEAIAELFKPYSERGIPIVGLEPSCIFTLRDDLQALPSRAKVEIVPIETFIAGHTHLPLKREARPIVVHGHCHQKGTETMKDTLRILERIGSVRLLDTGCCGMAGSFGYEAEHAAMSKKIAALKLVKELEKEKNAVIVANGTSCRAQISFEAQKMGHHIIEIIHNQLI